MPVITLEGVVHRVTYRSTKYVKPVIFINEQDHKKLYAWWRDNHIDTNLGELYHPILRKSCPQIQAESKAKDIKDGTLVKISLAAVTRRRGGRPHRGISTIRIDEI